MILSVGGNTDKKTIREFVDNYLLARDSKDFREHLRKTQPDIELTANYINSDGESEVINIPITVTFFWPE